MTKPTEAEVDAIRRKIRFDSRGFIIGLDFSTRAAEIASSMFLNSHRASLQLASKRSKDQAAPWWKRITG